MEKKNEKEKEKKRNKNADTRKKGDLLGTLLFVLLSHIP
jgi:hypothetical protein